MTRITQLRFAKARNTAIAFALLGVIKVGAALRGYRASCMHLLGKADPRLPCGDVECRVCGGDGA